MANVLFVWELGANFGHVARIRIIAEALIAEGHRCVFALRDLDAAAQYLPPSLGPILQSPVRLGAGLNPVARQVSYASVLNNTGFDDVPGLASRLRAWRALLHMVQPQVVVADHAPTAIIAARSMQLPCLRIGTGFSVPPNISPYPAFGPEHAASEALLLRNDEAVLQNLNQALHYLGLPKADSLQAAISDGESLLLGYAELDHFAERRKEAFIGVPEVAQGRAPIWPEGSGPKLIAYLRPSSQLPAALAALQRSRARVLVRVDEVRATELARWQRPGMMITDEMVNMQHAASQCHAYVNYGGHGMVAEMLLAGRPGLLLPDLQERGMVAKRVVAMGAGLICTSGEPEELDAGLERICNEPSLRLAAEAFAARYRDADRAAIPRRIAAAIVALAGKP